MQTLLHAYQVQTVEDLIDVWLAENTDSPPKEMLVEDIFTFHRTLNQENRPHSDSVALLESDRGR